MTALVVRGDARNLPLADASVDLIVTSPPYWALRDYRDRGTSLVGQIGAEPTPAEYVEALLECTREWLRVLKPSGSLFVNLGDKYAVKPGQGGPQGSTGQRAFRRQAATYKQQSSRPFGMRAKSRLLLPERYRLGCVDQLDLIARAVIIWSKLNGLPESVTDRVRAAHEDIVHLVKRERYFSAVDEIREPGVGCHPHRRNSSAATFREMGGHPRGALPGSVWEVASQPLIVPSELDIDHYAAFPPALVRRIILGWSPSGICVECGEGRRPIAIREGVDGHDWAQAQQFTRIGQDVPNRRKPSALGYRASERATSITGYACVCPEPTAPTQPAVVLDPFGGTGTTAMTADVLGRTGISVDLSADYCRLARWRTTDPRERARALGVPPPPPVADEQGDLFDIELAR